MHNSAMTSIAIIGPGAIGATVAAWLSRAGHAPTVCARAPLARLTIDTPDGRIGATPTVITTPVQARHVDWVLVCTKAYDVAATARWLLPLTGPTTWVAVLQNGVEHRERFAPVIGAARIVPVIVDIPAQRRGPGWVTQHRWGTLTMADDLIGQRFARLFENTAIEAVTTPDWTTAAWRKLCINACGIALTLIDRPFAAAHLPSVAAAMATLVEECAAVGRAAGADLPPDIAAEVIAYYQGQAPDLRNSLHVDLRAGRPLELDARNGVVVRLGERHGIATPAHRLAIQLVEALAA